MNAFEALRDANPRTVPGFAESVECAERELRARIADAARLPGRRRRRGALVAAVLATAAVTTLAAVGVPQETSATAAIARAAAVTAASAERSGTASVRITRDGELWAGTTVRWHGDDLALADARPGREGRVGDRLLVVDGTMYGVEDGGWVELGPSESVDPDSGTTPAEYLDAVREDVGGGTLSRILSAMAASTGTKLADGSTIYRGSVAAGVIARETGVKEGRSIRVLPFGFVAHDEAADSGAPLDVAVIVAADGVVRRLAVTWSAWRYEVAYSGLGQTGALAAPADAKPLRPR